MCWSSTGTGYRPPDNGNVVSVKKCKMKIQLQIEVNGHTRIRRHFTMEATLPQKSVASLVGRFFSRARG